MDNSSHKDESLMTCLTFLQCSYVCMYACTYVDNVCTYVCVYVVTYVHMYSCLAVVATCDRKSW